MNPKDYFNACQYFDWYYAFSDDGLVYRRGMDRERQLKAMTADNPELEAIFKAWESFYFSGPSWGTKRTPEPKLEDFISSAMV